jgi:hypothetical protein
MGNPPSAALASAHFASTAQSPGATPTSWNGDHRPRCPGAGAQSDQASKAPHCREPKVLGRL